MQIKDDNGICQTIWLGIFYYTKYKSNIRYKAIYNYAILYFIALIITN